MGNKLPSSGVSSSPPCSSNNNPPLAIFKTFTIPAIKSALSNATSLTCPPSSPRASGNSSPTHHLAGSGGDTVIEGDRINGFQLLVSKSLLDLTKTHAVKDTLDDEDGRDGSRGINPFNLPSFTIPDDYNLTPPLNFLTMTTLYSTRLKILIAVPSSPPGSTTYVLSSVSAFYRLHHLLRRVNECYEAGSLATTTDLHKVTVDAGCDRDQRGDEVGKVNRMLDNECPICMERSVEVVCDKCASGFCEECRLEWQRSVIERRKNKNDRSKVEGCAVCWEEEEGGGVDQGKEGGVPLSSSWHVETWSQNDLIEEIDSLEGMIGDELGKIRRGGRIVNTAKQLEGFYSIVFND